MTVQEELAVIRERHDGVLKPEHVVKYAENPKTALHDRFQWDDSEAAREYRLWQAREIIRVSVTIIPQAITGTQEVSVQEYVSLKADRVLPGGGYRTTVDVMSDKDMREQLLSQALDDLIRWKAKYKALRELSPVFEAMEKLPKAKRAGAAALLVAAVM